MSYQINVIAVYGAVLFVSVRGQQTLTTAKIIQDTTPKPTSLLRRINVERNFEENTQAPLDLFNLVPERRSRKKETIWNWDFWCQMQPKTGSCNNDGRTRTSYVDNLHNNRVLTERGSSEGCNASHILVSGTPQKNGTTTFSTASPGNAYPFSIKIMAPSLTDDSANDKFYYDAQLDQCLSFVYSGCNGNKNNFDTLVECDRHCKGAIYMPLKETTRQGSCTLQPNSGLCMALLTRYYYDVNTDACKKFIYGGCGGNQNRFQSDEQCLDNCNS